MIIDQLPEISTVQETDEIPVERGTTTYKSTLRKLKDLVASLLIKYVDKSDISVSISSNGGYQSLGTFTSLGVPAGATVVSFFIKGWNGANGAPVLLASTDGKTLYCMMSDAPATVTLSVRVFYAL
jgi:hypothetical protein